MAKGYLIYNPLAGNGNSEAVVEKIKTLLEGEVEVVVVTKITDYAKFVQSMEKDDYIVLTGGDGTLNRFANQIADLDVQQEILYYPSGNGNDFARDVEQYSAEKPFPIAKYLKNLPTVEVNGKTYRFINGVGYGIDGYCCEMGDKQKLENPGKNVNYAGIAIKGLLFKYKARNAKITVDGKEYTYKKVWLAPTMHGRYYGGGMIAAPAQDRMNNNGILTLMMFHGAGKLRSLIVFPNLFKGTHVDHPKVVSILTGSEITVEFDRPTPLQIDGETIVDVTRYTAKAPVPVKENATV